MKLSSGQLAAGISLAGVSTIACIIAVEVLLYYKMWRTFIYRLVLYMFMFLIVFNSTTIILNCCLRQQQPTALVSMSLSSFSLMDV